MFSSETLKKEEETKGHHPGSMCSFEEKEIWMVGVICVLWQAPRGHKKDEVQVPLQNIGLKDGATLIGKDCFSSDYFP